jgi:hypothetical protein
MEIKKIMFTLISISLITFAIFLVAGCTSTAPYEEECEAPIYPDAELESMNQIMNLAQSAYISDDTVDEVKSFYDTNMPDFLTVMKDWTRGTKIYHSSDFSAEERTGCSIILEVGDNQNPGEGTTIGIVTMRFD